MIFSIEKVFGFLPVPPSRRSRTLVAPLAQKAFPDLNFSPGKGKWSQVRWEKEIDEAEPLRPKLCIDLNMSAVD